MLRGLSRRADPCRIASVRCSALVIALASAAAAGAPPAGPTLQRQAADRVAALARAGGGRPGVCAIDLATGRTIIDIRADEMFLPASNQKLLTSAFALVRLGAGFRFATGVFLVDGSVVVAGEGDPTLGDPRVAAERGRSVFHDLDRWADAVRRRAGGKVGDILLCCPPGRPLRHADWPANQHDRWYAAPVATLNFHNNCFDVSFVRTGGRLQPVVSPMNRYLRVKNLVRLGGQHRWSVRAADGDTTLVLTGSVTGPTGEPGSVAVNDPPMLLGRTFADRLIRAGVEVTGRLRKVTPREVAWSRAEPVCRTTTPLFVAMRRANKRSFNMVAECLFLRAGDGTWAGSVEMMAETLTRTFALPGGSIVPADGGGLGRGNRVSPAAVARLLARAARRPDGVVLLGSLPIGGVDGTLASRFRRPPCRGRVVAKTGYIRGVSCLSGCLLDRQRRVRYTFSVLVNGIRGGTGPAKALQESICRLLIDAMDAAPPASTAPS